MFSGCVRAGSPGGLGYLDTTIIAWTLALCRLLLLAHPAKAVARCCAMLAQPYASPAFFSLSADISHRQLLPTVKAQLDYLRRRGGAADLLSKQEGASQAAQQMQQPAHEKYVCDACGQYSLALRACSVCKTVRYCR